MRMKNLKSNEYKFIENALYAFICIGKSEIIQELIDTLNREGTKTMAEAYLRKLKNKPNEEA
jgi:pyruvate/2-oxoacid:ferredoxin oxidoreductase alpha subunit